MCSGSPSIRSLGSFSLRVLQPSPALPHHSFLRFLNSVLSSTQGSPFELTTHSDDNRPQSVWLSFEEKRFFRCPRSLALSLLGSLFVRSAVNVPLEACLKPALVKRAGVFVYTFFVYTCLLANKQAFSFDVNAPCVLAFWRKEWFPPPIASIAQVFRMLKKDDDVFLKDYDRARVHVFYFCIGRRVECGCVLRLSSVLTFYFTNCFS